MTNTINSKSLGARLGRRCLNIATAAALATASQAMAYQGYWTSFINPGTGDWSNPANWSYGYAPGLSDQIYINSNGTADISSGAFGANEGIFVGQGSGQGGTIDLSGGSLTTTGNIYLADATGANGTLDQTGGSINIINTYGLYVGNLGTGTYNMSGGTAQFGSAIIQGAGSEGFIIGSGAGGSGTMNLSGGTITSYDVAQMGRGTGSTGVLNMTGGALNVAHDFWGGFGTTGGQDTITQSAGTITTGWADTYPNTNGTSTADGAFEWGFGNTAATLSTYTMSGTAALNVNSYLYVGGVGGNTAEAADGGYGSLVMNGGTINVGGADNNVGNLFIGSAGSSTQTANGSVTVNAGTISLLKNGAVLAIGQTATATGATGAGTGTLTINGGQVLMPNGTVYIGRANGSNGANGTLNLAGGVLQAQSLVWITASSTDTTTKVFNFTGGTFDLSNAATAFPMTNAGGTLSPGGAGVATALTFTGTDGSYTQTGAGTLALDLLSNSSADSLNTSAGGVGTVTLGGNVSVTAASGYTPAFGATFPVIVAKSISDTASWSLPTLPSGFTWDQRITADGGTGNSVETLSVVPSSPKTNVAAGDWEGGSVNANFVLGGSGGEATISTGVTAGYVQFDSSGSWTVDGTGTLNIATSSGTGGIIAFGGSHDISAPVNFTSGGEIATTVSTTSVTIDGSISGAGTIEKTGPGSLVLTSNSSTFTGSWQISGGSVNIASDANLGDPSASLIMAGGTLNAPNGWTTARSISLQGSGGTFNVGSGSTLSGVISGPGGITVTGSSSVTISNSNNNYSGKTTVLSGNLIQGADYAIPSSSAVVLTTGTQLQLNGTNASIGSLANSGTGASKMVDTGGGNLTVGSDNTSTVYNGDIEGEGSGTFTKVGTGTLTINGVSSSSGYVIDTDPGQMINVNGGMLQVTNLSAALQLPSDVTVAAGATFAISGAYGMATGVHGAGSFQINVGGGLVELGGNNDYTGGTKIQTGTNTTAAASTIELDDMSEFGPDGTPVTFLPTLGATIGSATTTLNFLSTGTFAHPINMPGQNVYTITFSGTNSGSSATNPIIISQPVLGLSQIYYSSGTFLVEAQSTNSQTNVHPAGSVVDLGINNAFSPNYYTLVNGTLNLNGYNQFSGSLIGQSTGLINLSAGNTLTIGADNLNSQQISSTSYGGGYSGTMTGAGALTKVGTGDAVLTLAAPTTTNPAYTGPTTVEVGTLWFAGSAAAAQGTSGFTVDPGAMLILGFAATATISQPITGGGIVEKATTATDTLVLGGTNSYTGGTNIAAGTVSVSQDANLGASSGVIRFIDNGTAQVLQFAAGFDTPNFTQNMLMDYETTTNTQYAGTIDTTTNNITASGVISSLGTGGLGKNGTGMLTLTGPNTFNGNVYVNNGILSVASIGGGSSGAASNLGQPIAGTSIYFGTSTTAGELLYTGVGESSNRGIILSGNGDLNNSGTGTLTLSGNVALGAYGLTLDGPGNGSLAGQITGSAGTTPGSLTKQGTGTWTLSGVGVIPGAVNANAGALRLAATQTYGSLNIASTGSVAMTASSVHPNLLTTSSLSIVAGGTLDLTNNDLAVTYTGVADPLATIVGYLTAAYNVGSWNHPGLTTSFAAAHPGTTLGYVDNVTTSKVLVSYTWYGDLDLSGTVDATDFGMMDNIPTSGPQAGVIGWFDGDLNYDGKINSDDWALFMLGAAESNGANINSVPEPASLSLLAVAGIVLSRKRRR
jgi:fibronectin-binding autotransporter adhesin